MSYAILDTIQADVLAVLKNLPALTGANILTDANGDLDSRVDRLLGIQAAGSGGKRGLAVIVLAPEVDAPEENLPGPPMLLKLDVQILEHVQTNRGPAGTGITSSQAALMALSALHLRMSGPLALYAAPKAIQPLPVLDGLVSHSVTLQCRTGGVLPAKVASVHPSEADDVITLTCATEGAAIYYTTDGTYPTPTNGTLYEEPLVGVTVGTYFRAAAYKAAMNPSDCIEFEAVLPANTIADGAFVLTDGDGSFVTDS